MIDSVQWVLAILLSLPPAYADNETTEQRDDRMFTIASAIDEVSDRATCQGFYDEDGCLPIWSGTKRQLDALLVTKGWWESRFSLRVHAGKCRPDECDFGRARSPWQLQRTAYSEPEWSTMVGVGLRPTRQAAWSAAKVLSEGMRRCKSPHGALAWYGVQRCQWSGAKNRFGTYSRLIKY
jgi:hypothetical protein